MDVTRREQLDTTPLFGGNADYVEALYELYQRDPSSVDAH